MLLLGIVQGTTLSGFPIRSLPGPANIADDLTHEPPIELVITKTSSTRLPAHPAVIRPDDRPAGLTS